MQVREIFFLSEMRGVIAPCATRVEIDAEFSLWELTKSTFWREIEVIHTADVICDKD